MPAKKKSKFDARPHWPKHCIAANCKRPHTGPRFRFMCVEHRMASDRQIYAWQKAHYARLYADRANGKVSISLHRMLVAFGIVPKGKRTR